MAGDNGRSDSEEHETHCAVQGALPEDIAKTVL